jgi:ribosomal protein S18 acetylase RimI-like enzyme
MECLEQGTQFDAHGLSASLIVQEISVRELSGEGSEMAALLMVGCIDLIEGYPEPDTATLGLLLIAESFQGQGIGSEAYRATEATVRAWGTCTKIRLGVVRTNAAVLPFWIRLGFTETGESKPYSCGPVLSEIVILTKTLVS